jgi:hypothetical protein
LNLALLNLLHQCYKKVNSLSFGGRMPNLSVLLGQKIVNLTYRSPRSLGSCSSFASLLENTAILQQSMSLCINPRCPKPSDPLNSNSKTHCRNCGSELFLQKRYQVIRLLSDTSGFGNVYEIEEQGIPKILKILKEHLSVEAKAVELFQQEAVVLSRNSPEAIANPRGCRV